MSDADVGALQELSNFRKQITALDKDCLDKKIWVNIGFWGEPGVGKSCTINTILRALNQMKVDRATVGPGDRPQTILYANYQLWAQHKDSCVNIWDTKGMSRTLKKDDTDSIIIGQCLDGKFGKTKLRNTVDMRQQGSILNYPWWDLKIHAAVFVVSFKNPPPDEDEIGDSLLAVIANECNTRGIPVHVVITHNDYTNEMLECEGLSHTREDVLTYLQNAGVNSIDPITNYTLVGDARQPGNNEQLNSLKIDRIILRAFEKILSSAVGARKEMDKTRFYCTQM